MPKIKANGLNLYYETYGKGQPIVFVAGFAVDHTTWHTILAHFAKTQQVIIFDNRGVGQSDCPDYPYTLEMMADDTIALVNALGLKESVHFVGSSMGGIIVQYIAHRYPQLAKSLVISNSCYCPYKHSRLAIQIRALMALRRGQTFNEDILKIIFTTVYSNNFLAREGLVEQLAKLVLANPCPITDAGYEYQGHALLNADSSAWLNKITCPCLVLNGDEDFFADAQQLRGLIEKISDAQYFCFKQVGHLPHIEQPAAFSKVVLDFIGGKILHT